MFEDPEAPIYEGDKFGTVNFICRMSLAVNEMAIIEVKSRLAQQTLSKRFTIL